MKSRFLGLCFLIACTRSADPRLYTLVADKGSETSAASATVRSRAEEPRASTIEVRRPSIAGYLDRREVVRAVRSERLDVATDSNWAEPLDAMIGRVLAADLALRLPHSRVLTDLSSLGVVPELRIDTEIQRFEQDSEGLVLRAVVAVRRGAQTQPVSLELIELRDKVDGDDTAAVVSAMNALLGKLADRLAGTLVSILAEPGVSSVPESATGNPQER